eukprot:11667073-Karenia_brevis.AAC.1
MVAADASERKTSKKKTTPCFLCGPMKIAQATDPATQRRYCRLCFADIRPDIACLQEGRTALTSKEMPKITSSGSSMAVVVPFTPRCFGCFKVGDDVAKHDCEHKKAYVSGRWGSVERIPCSAVWLCASCRSSCAVIVCPMCWATAFCQLPLRPCYKCREHVVLESMLDRKS